MPPLPDTRDTRWLKSNNPALYRQIQELPWVLDGTSVLERDTIIWLIWLQQLAPRNETTATEIIAMPFLETFELGDLQIMRGLFDAERTGQLDTLLTNPMFRSGITDDHVLMISIGAGMAYSRADAEAINRMLSPGYTDIETVAAGTEFSPDMIFSVVRTGLPAQPWTLGTMRDSVELVERVMGMPLPVAHVVNVISEEHVKLGREGGHQASSFNSPPKWHGKKDTREGHLMQEHIVHEVAHYFWRGHMKGWISEGVARTFEYLFGEEQGLEPTTYANTRDGCQVHDLQMLDDVGGLPDTPEWICVYYLGAGLWIELSEHLGVGRFGEKMQELYLIHRDELWPRRSRELGIEDVRRVFATESDIVEKHWSGKLNAPENRPWDEGMAHSSHNLIQWDQHPTYDGEFVTFSGSLLGDAVLSSGTIKEAERDGYQNFHLYPVRSNEFGGNIYPPGWGSNMRHSGDTTALEYRLEDRTFTVKFRFPQKLGDPSDYIVDVWGFQDESRTPVIWPDRDRLGYARIRVE